MKNLKNLWQNKVKEHKKVVIYVETVYSLLIGLVILFSRKNLSSEDIVFFYSENNKLITEIAKKFKINLKKEEIKHPNKLKVIFEAFINNNKIIKKLNDKKVKEIFIQDHIKESQFILNNVKKKIYLLEDGTSNYNEKLLAKQLKIKKKSSKEPIIIKLKIWIYRKFINKLNLYYSEYGTSYKISKIYLTGILPIPDIIKDKVEIINIEKLWDDLKNERKEEILNIFNVSLEEVEILKKENEKVLLLTQPLSEDGIIEEKEKIELYKQIILERKIKKIYIKPHPREKTNYIEVFKNIGVEVKILSNKFPAEIFMLLDMKFKKVITIFSTAALNFKYKYEIEFIGTKKYSKLYEKFGDISLKE